MKKSLILPMVLALVLSASVVFAGFSASPSPSGDFMVIVMDNTVPDLRVFHCVVTSDSGQRVEEEFPIRQGGKQTLYYWSEPSDPNQHWEVKITDGVGGKVVGEAVFNYNASSRAFSPASISSSIRYEAGVGKISLIITE